MSKAKLKKHLLPLTKEQVVDIMLELYGASKEASTWLEFYLEPNSEAELEKYKKEIRSQFFGRNDWRKRVSGSAINSSPRSRNLYQTLTPLPTSCFTM